MPPRARKTAQAAPKKTDTAATSDTGSQTPESDGKQDGAVPPSGDTPAEETPGTPQEPQSAGDGDEPPVPAPGDLADPEHAIGPAAPDGDDAPQPPGADRDDTDGEQEPAPTEPRFHWERAGHPGAEDNPCRQCLNGAIAAGVGSVGCPHGQWVRVTHWDE